MDSVPHLVLARGLGLLRAETVRSTLCRGRVRGGASTPRSSPGRSPTARRSSPGSRRTRCSSRATSAIRRSATTGSPASRSPHCSHAPSPRCRAALLVPLSLRARHDRVDRLARRERAGGAAHQARARARVRRRPGAADVQAEPPRDAEIDRAVELVLRDKGAPFSVRRLLPVRLRRAAVLLAGLRPAGGLPDAHAARRVRRVPHLGRRPRPRAPGSRSRTRSTPACESSTCSSGAGVYVNLKPKGEPQLGRYGLYGSLGGGHHGERAATRAAVGAEPVRRQQRAARRRGALGPAVRAHRRGRRPARGRGSPRGEEHEQGAGRQRRHAGVQRRVVSARVHRERARSDVDRLRVHRRRQLQHGRDCRHRARVRGPRSADPCRHRG